MTGHVSFGGRGLEIPIKRVFKNGSNRVITVRVLVLGDQWGDEKTMAPGDSLSIPDIPGEYVVELLT